jgi:hypothetical protein
MKLSIRINHDFDEIGRPVREEIVSDFARRHILFLLSHA